MKLWWLTLAWLGLGATASAQEDADLRDTAWTRSVAAEVAGDLTLAEAILDEAWGQGGGNYFIRLRRAYLTLLGGQFAQAEERYLALRATEEGAADPDVSAGLQLARTRTLPFTTVAIAPTARATPEAWGAVVGQNLGNSRYLGGAVFAHVPVAVTPELKLHVAGRFVSYQRQGGGSRWAFESSGARQINLGDAFLGATYERARWGADAVGVYEKSSGTNAIGGGSLRGRVGQNLGLLMDGTLLMSAGSSANWQVAPRAFYWPVPSLGLRAGTRLTLDGRQSASVLAGASLLLGGHSVHVDGHLGNERAALDPTTFSLLNLAADATMGGTLTLALRLGSTVRLLTQAQGERLRSDGAEGAYWSASLGLDVALGTL